MRAKTKTKSCKVCGQDFKAVRGAERWPSTCSPPCRLVALDRFINVMVQRRDAMAAELGEPPRAGEPATAAVVAKAAPTRPDSPAIRPAPPQEQFFPFFKSGQS